jgi:Ino eighty subunit 1
MTVAHIRRNANGTIGSVFSGHKIRHLRKDDGIPLWRKNIQLEFLLCVLNDETPVLTKAYDGTKGHTFVDGYVDAMARSSKTSKVLKDKSLVDRDGAMHMAIVCLLFNVGRI